MTVALLYGGNLLCRDVLLIYGKANLLTLCNKSINE